METIFSSGDFLTIFVLLAFMVALILLIKYIDGDFSPISIEEVDRQVIESKDSNNNVNVKKIVITYKKTYKDGRIKMSYKTINMN